MKRPAYYPFKSAAAEKEYLAYYQETAIKRWPVPFVDVTVDTTYGSTYARVSGPQLAPPLVLLPGINASSLMWSPNVAAWSQHYRVYAVDLISDFGRSRDSRLIWRKADFINWLDEYFTKLGLRDNINLVGMSYGGWLAALYALDHPDRLRKVALLAPGATVLKMNWTFLRRSAESALWGGKYSEGLFNWLFADGLKKGQGCALTMSDFGHCLYMGTKCFKKRFFVYLTVLSDAQWQALQVPTLFMVGEHEKLYSPLKALQRLEKVAPQVQTSLVPGAGHDLTSVQAELINEQVLQFLQA